MCGADDSGKFVSIFGVYLRLAESAGERLSETALGVDLGQCAAVGRRYHVFWRCLGGWC